MSKQFIRKKANDVSRRFFVALISFLMLFAFSGTAFAQGVRSITGTVVDAAGEPVIGATVRVQGQKNMISVTDLDGKFKMNAPQKGKLEVSFIGYVTATLNLSSQSSYKVTMKEDDKTMDDIVVVGYGTQKKVTLTGAIAQIGGDKIAMTKTQDTRNMLTGKIPGVRVTQNTSEPGDFSNGNFDIRGYGAAPLIVVDGVPGASFLKLDPNEIESVSVLKDASAAVYGARGGNGVILITTKKGSKDKTRIQYSMYWGIQTPAEVLRPVGAIDRMTLFNEKSMRNPTAPSLTYNDEAFEAYYSGQKTSTDWYDYVMAKTAPQQQHNVSVSGGTNKFDYFVNFGYMDQKGFLKSNDLDYNRYNLRANLNASITDNLKISVKLSGMIDKRNRPHTSTITIFNNLWRSIPDETVYANNNPLYFQKPTADIQNPVAAMSSDVAGYIIDQNKTFNSIFEGEYTLPWVKGLKAKALFSYNTSIADNTNWNKSYNVYQYNEATDEYSPYAVNSPSQLQRSYGNSWNRLFQASMSYDNTFAAHHVSGLLLYEESYAYYDNINASRYFTLQIPYLYAGDSENQTGNGGNISETARRALVGRYNYDYAGKYMVEFSFRYDGSSKFAKGHRWGFFPGISAGWRISEEKFIKNKLNFVDNIKLRGSYGEMGDDGNANFTYLTGFDYPNTSGALYNNYPKGYVFDGIVYNALGFRAIANPELTWYKIKTANVGLDVDLWKGLLGFTAEFFVRNRSGLMATKNSTIPGTFGSTLPSYNLNSDRTKGFEFELRHRNRIGKFNYNITANLSLTRSMNVYLEKNPDGNSYQRWLNRNNLDRYNDIWFGYTGNGRFENWEQIQNEPTYGMGNGASETLPGDYRYEDWNGDGVIDGNDKHPIATTLSSNGGSFDSNSFQNQRNYPLMNFGINIGGDWKGIDFNLTFQGSAMSYIAFGEQLSAPLAWNGNALDLFLDRWHPVNPKQDPYDPSAQWVSGYYAYGGRTPDINSTFAIQKGDYIRLKTIEIGYTLPAQWLTFTGITNTRVFFNAYNLFTITGVKGVDPEKPANGNGYMYPLNRTYNFGLSVSF